METQLSLSAMERILKKAGAARVGEDAKEELCLCLEEYAHTLAQRAIENAKHAQRRTIKASDIRLARR